MKKHLYLLVAVSIFFLTACQQQELIGKDEEMEEIVNTESECKLGNGDELYEETFVKESDNWRISLHAKELEKTAENSAETNIELTYLKEFSSNRFDFEYEIYFDNPSTGGIIPKSRLLKGQKSIKDDYDSFNFIKVLKCRVLTIEVRWEDEDGEKQMDYFQFPEAIAPTKEVLEEKVTYFLKHNEGEINSLIKLETSKGLDTESNGVGEIVLYLSHDQLFPELDTLEHIESISKGYLHLFEQDYAIDKITMHWQVPDLAEDAELVELVFERKLGKFKITEEKYDDLLSPF